MKRWGGPLLFLRPNTGFAYSGHYGLFGKNPSLTVPGRVEACPEECHLNA